ncbi:hypothetical protein [Arthrobacter sp. HLT1-20]
MNKRAAAVVFVLGMSLAGWGLQPAVASDPTTPPTTSAQTMPAQTEQPLPSGNPQEPAPAEVPVPTVSQVPPASPKQAVLPVGVESSGSTIEVRGLILDKWKSLGGAEGLLGNPTAERTCSMGPCRQEFVGGTIFESYTDRAVVIFRTIGNLGPHWFAAGGLSSGIGYPKSDEIHVGQGSTQEFLHLGGGSTFMLTWRAKYGVLRVDPASGLGFGWFHSGGLQGPGYPTSNLACGLRDGGCSQSFDAGLMVSSDDTRGTLITGGIQSKWANLSAQDGYLGYPTWKEECSGVVVTCLQSFQGGNVIWSAAAGSVAVQGGIGAVFMSTGSVSVLGYPLTDEVCRLRDGGCMQNFRFGRIAWSPKTGAHAVKGAIGGKYQALGAQNGFLGYPTTEEACGIPGGGCKQSFQSGDIVWSPKTGAHTMRGAIRSAHSGIMPGWIGPEGYPTGEEVCGLPRKGCYQQYQGGRIYWSAASGPAQLVKNGILANWTKLGGPAKLGYPTWNEVCATGYCRQQFQFGVVTWSAPGAMRW